ncbi:MAG TPA: HAD family hydrolase, partial [Desulfobacterales bacterium]|nr:HAD family hydrolase [Desulfobacterales bacterium]
MVEIREELASRGRSPSGLFVTDLDGTLLRSDRTFAAADLAALRRLGECGVVRVLATGRSLFSFEKVRTSELPLDYLVFSTGAGLAELPSGRIVRAQSLAPAEVRRACEVLRALALDFMVQRPIPETHAFAFHASGRPNPDFDRRIALYERFAFPLDGDAAGFGPATQLVAIVPPEGSPETLPEVRRLLPELTVIRSTSPLDHRSTWIEIFPATVSKSRTTGWLADRLGIPRARTVAVGNDYNDLDLLDWAAERFVTANA